MWSNSKEQLLKSHGEMISLTDLWKEIGSPKNKEIKRWLESEPVNRFIKTVSALLKVGISDVIKIKRGRNGGTWGHKQIAIEDVDFVRIDNFIKTNSLFASPK